MTRDEIHGALRSVGKTVEAVAVEHGFPYAELCRVIRTGHVGPPGSRTWQMAMAVANEIGKPFLAVWGLPGQRGKHHAS